MTESRPCEAAMATSNGVSPWDQAAGRTQWNQQKKPLKLRNIVDLRCFEAIELVETAVVFPRLLGPVGLESWNGKMHRQVSWPSNNWLQEISQFRKLRSSFWILMGVLNKNLQ